MGTRRCQGKQTIRVAVHGHGVLAKPQTGRFGLRHGGDMPGFDRVHLLNQTEYPGQVLGIGRALLFAHFQTGKMRYLFYIVPIQRSRSLVSTDRSHATIFQAPVEPTEGDCYSKVIPIPSYQN